MKNLKLLALILSLIVLSCQENEIINQESLSIDDYGKIHNESVNFLIKKYSELNSSRDFNTLAKVILEEMAKKYPAIYSYEENADIGYIFLNKKQSFNFESLYESLKLKAIEKGASNELISFYDSKFSKWKNNKFISKESVVSKKYEIKNVKEIESVDVFNSIYSSSEKLWLNEVPKEYQLKVYHSKRGCDPSQQVILADAITGGLLSLIAGPLGAIGGGAASYLVREQQIQNYGGCI